VKPSAATSAAIRIVAPARLHLGFLDLNGAIGRRYGSIGLAVDRPATDLTLTQAPEFDARGPESARALDLLLQFAEEQPSRAYGECELRSGAQAGVCGYGFVDLNGVGAARLVFCKFLTTFEFASTLRSAGVDLGRLG
jgi:hypothetical protein